jgi:hypothetical protein
VHRVALFTLLVVAGIATAAAQPVPPSPRHEALVAAMKPALPYPVSNALGSGPESDDAQSPWFVIWPSGDDDARVIVRANPLHPDTQKMGAAAMRRIQEAVVAAEQKAQAAYARALEELKRSGTTTADLAGISLDDEGVAGERIDAELELTIEWQPDVTMVTGLASSEAPSVTAGPAPGTWTVSTKANVYREPGPDGRERFRPAEARVFYGLREAPIVRRTNDGPAYTIAVQPSAQSFVIVVSGNEQLLSQVVAVAQWSALAVKVQFY